jgi:hypothetical protein
VGEIIPFGAESTVRTTFDGVSTVREDGSRVTPNRPGPSGYYISTSGPASEFLELSVNV